jgi:nucleoside-diphosphate-sugar epimerase
VSRFLVTGASGFVGSAVCRLLRSSALVVRGAVRSLDGALAQGVEPAVVGSIGPSTEWAAALAGVDCVVHLAARVHEMRDRAPDPLAAHREVNAAGTERLARAAAGAGVRRLVFLSSVKVLGEARDAPYTAEDEPAPSGPYAVSKWEAEQALWRVSRDSDLGVVVLRSPLVYGPGVRANFLSLMRLVERGVPLPFAAVQNRRSLVFVDNLADAIRAVAQSPRAAGKTYLLSDGEDVSTPELVRRIAEALGTRERLLAVPPVWIRAMARLAGRAAAADRVLGSLAVDSGPIRRDLGWSPPYTMRHGLAVTAEWYRGGRAGRAPTGPGPQGDAKK